MRTLAIDIETYSSISLKDCGVHVYAESIDFEILLFGYAFDDEPVRVVDIARGENLPDEVTKALVDPGILKTAFNAPFERTCISKWLGVKLPADEWSCTAVMARELGYPSSLEAVGKAIGLPEDQQKLKTGKALIRYFSLPCTPTKVNGDRARNLPEHDLERWQMYKEYNKQDVETERAIRNILSVYPIHPSEHALWVLDQRVNDRGVLVDTIFAQKAIDADEQNKAPVLQKFQALTGLDNPKSVVQLKAWLENEAGFEIESLEKKAIPALKTKANSERINKALEYRSQCSKTSTEKYKAMLRCAGSDHRARGLTMFYGAGRTGRWAGRLIQMQNLPRNYMKDLDDARECVMHDCLDMMYDNPADVLSQLIRTAFIPKPGCKFIVSDFSAIEARVIAWFAEEQWRLDVFNTHGKIYEASAEMMFRLPAGSVKKGSPERTKGKIAELALGYGGSTGALKAMGALDMGLKEPELKPLVDAWRHSNPHIVQFWWDVGSMVEKALMGHPGSLRYGIAAEHQGDLLRITLPNGRQLSYVNPKLQIGAGKFDSNLITYDGVIQKTGAWGRVETYGPKLVENIVQATSRDCLAESMKRLEANGIPIVFHVHDEVICEVPINSYSADDIAEIMSEPISWAPGLPLRADAYECGYYRKD